MNFKSNKRKGAYDNVRKYFSLVLVLCMWGIIPQLQAQSNSSENTKTVKGIVLDEMNDPMIGVTVMEKGTRNGTITDINGKFQLKVASTGAKLVISYIGYASKEVAIGAGDMKIQLTTDAKMIDEVVVIGYGTQKKASIVGAITQTTSADIKKQGMVTNMTNALAGTMPGVTVLSMTGIPGGDGGDGFSQASQILIRGKNTWNNAAPLILVDGVERSMNDVDINEVESVSVLKDASATAVFGMKGGNGVILITSKRGVIGKPKLTFEANKTYESLSKYAPIADSYTALRARNYGILNVVDATPASWKDYKNETILNHFRDQDMPYAFPDINWKEEMSKDFASSTRFNFNVSGGTKFVNYFGSLSYLNEGDVMNTQDLGNGYNPEFSYDRFNVRTNYDFTISKTTKLKTNLSGMYGRQQKSRAGVANVSSLYTSIYSHTPNTPVIMYEDGVYGYTQEESNLINGNEFAGLNNTGTKVYNRFEILSDFTLEQKLDFITKGLTLKGKLAYDNYFATTGPDISDGGYNSKWIDPKFYLAGGKYNYDTKVYELNGVPIPDMIQAGYAIYSNNGTSNGFGWTPGENGYDVEYVSGGSARYRLYYEASLQYSREFGKHNVSALALFSRQKSESGSDYPEKREDYVGRVTYDYNGRYFAEFNGAYNGSEAFGPGYKFDFFPSVAVGWNIANEQFVKTNAPYIQTLKIKYSNGLVGNDKVGDVGQWPYLSNWEKGTFLTNDNGNNFGLIPVASYQVYREGVPGNPNLHWELAKKQNLGTEFSLFKGLISGSVDLFKEHRYDMLVAAADRLQLPAVGQKAPAANIGIVDSKGMEIEGSVSKSYKNGFNFKFGGSWTFSNNIITYKEDAKFKPFYQKNAGYPIGQIRLNQQTGFIESWDDAYTGVISVGSNTTRLPGDFLFTDYNGNGKIDPDDAAPYGFPTIPRSTYTISFNGGYKGWNMSVLFYGTHNVTRGAGGSVFMFGTASIHERYITSTITPELGNVNPTYPQFFSGSGAGTYNFYDGSLLRLKSVELSYTLPKAWTKFVGLAGARLYANGNNLFVWTKLPSDGEGDADGQGRNYPMKRTATIGANIQF